MLPLGEAASSHVHLLHAGMANQVLSYVGDQLVLKYTGGEMCHKVYQRSTEIYFSCHPDQNPVSVLQRQQNLMFLLDSHL